MENPWQERLRGKRVGLALCGSFCTFTKVFEVIQELAEAGALITPIISQQVKTLDTRFGTADAHIQRLRELTGNEPLSSATDTEPIGPKALLDVLAVAPCTGNTLAKLAQGIIDTPVTMAVKSHLRGGRPVVLAVSTNDGLSGSAKHLGTLLNYRHYYFCPLGQDDWVHKPNSLVADYSLLPQAISEAVAGRQLQPILTK